MTGDDRKWNIPQMKAPCLVERKRLARWPLRGDRYQGQEHRDQEYGKAVIHCGAQRVETVLSVTQLYQAMQTRVVISLTKPLCATVITIARRFHVFSRPQPILTAC